jgi:ABC-type uncharacterized transport system substrate-binding protein
MPQLTSGVDVRRREFITLVGGATVAWPLTVRAQQSASVPKIGVLWPGAAPPTSPRMESFRLALRQFGYIEGQTVAIELRYAEKGVRQLSELAAELVHEKVNVITAFGDLAPKIAQQATQTIPIVAICDDIELAASYRLPVIHALRAAAVEGGLISYGADLPNLFRQAAVYADRIFKGTNPADLPISQPQRNWVLTSR